MSKRENVTVYHCERCNKDIIGNYQIEKKLKNGAIGECLYSWEDSEGADADNGMQLVPEKAMNFFPYVEFPIPTMVKDPENNGTVNGGEKLAIAYKFDDIVRGYCGDCFSEIADEYFEQVRNFQSWAKDKGIIV